MNEAKPNKCAPGRANYVCLAGSQIVAAALWQAAREKEGSEREREQHKQATCSLQLHNKSNLINWGQSARTSIGAGRIWAQVAY